MRSPSASDRPFEEGPRAEPRRIGRAVAANPAALVVAALACALPGTAAAADVKQECSEAYDRVQALRPQGKLIAARREAVVCARDACTAFIRTDCAKWVPEIDASTPSVVFEVLDAAGKETVDVRVILDGKELLAKLDGKAVAIDPGVHSLRYEIAGATAVEETVQVREGEKNRKLAATFEKKSEATAAAPPAAMPTSSPSGLANGAPTASPSTGGVPTWAWIAGGAGLVSVGVGIGFLADHVTTQSAIDGACANKNGPEQTAAGCTPLFTKPLKSRGDRDTALAAVFGGVGVIALGVSIFGIATARPSGTSAPGPVTWMLPTVWLLPGTSGASIKGVF